MVDGKRDQRIKLQISGFQGRVCFFSSKEEAEEIAEKNFNLQTQDLTKYIGISKVNSVIEF